MLGMARGPGSGPGRGERVRVCAPQASRAEDDARGGVWPVWAEVLYGCRVRAT
jgi:hypothetical protein